MPLDHRARSAAVMRAISCARDVGVARTEPRDEFHVPIVMQVVEPDARAAHELAIAALIVIIARVQRLVQVAHQVQQELQRDAPLRFRSVAGFLSSA